MSKVVTLPVTSRKNTGGKIADPLEGLEQRPARRGRFIRGKSGNPTGRTPGSGNKSHARLRAILADDAERVLDRVISAALDGDMLAARLVLDRVLPRRSCRPSMNLDLPPLKTASDAADALTRIVHASAEGFISTSEATALASVINTFASTLIAGRMAAEIAAMQQRLDELH